MVGGSAAERTRVFESTWVVHTRHLQRLVDGERLPCRRVDRRAGQGLCRHYVEQLQAQLRPLRGHIAPGPGVLAVRVTAGRALETIWDSH